MKPPLNIKSSDDFQTPKYALDPLLPYLKKEWTIWECSEGKGNLSNAFFYKGYNVIGSDLFNKNDYDINNYNGVKDNFYKRFFEKDFLNWNPDNFDCIVTNPPYSLKQQFLKRCYEFEKPFALLLPLTTFETKKRQDLFKKYGLEVIFLPKRVNFETPSGKGSGSWFATAWFTNGLNLPNQLNFYDGGV